MTERRAARRDALVWRLGRLALLGFTGLWLLFMVAPLVVVVIVSFTSANYLLFPPPGLSLRWYHEVLQLSWFWSSLSTSLTVAVISTAATVTLGTLAARALARRRFRGRTAIELLVLSPLLLPGVVIGFALFNLLVLLRLEGLGLPNLIAGHLLITLPFVVRSVWATMVGTDASLEEAAMGMGATPFAAFRHVTLPMAAPGIAAGAILAFTYSFNDVTVSIFLTSPGVTTLPVQLMADMETSANAVPAAVSSLMIALMLLIFLAVVRVGGLKAFLQS